MFTLKEIIGIVDSAYYKTSVCSNYNDSGREQKIVLGFVCISFVEQGHNILVREFLDRLAATPGREIYFDQLLRPIGYISWLTSTASSSGSLVRRQRRSAKPQYRQPSEYRHIVDFFFRRGDIHSMLRGVRQGLLSVHHAICYARGKPSGKRQVRVIGKPGIRSTPKSRETDMSGSEQWKSRTDVLEMCRDRLAEYAVLGEGLIALSKSPQYVDMSLKAALTMLATASGIGQMRIYYNNVGEVTGLLTWAWISQWTMDRFSSDDQLPMHASEWNEGLLLCFRDIVVSPESAPQIAVDLSDGLFPEESACAVMIRDRTSRQVVLFQIAELQRKTLGSWIRSQFDSNRSPAIQSDTSPKPVRSRR